LSLRLEAVLRLWFERDVSTKTARNRARRALRRIEAFAGERPHSATDVRWLLDDRRFRLVAWADVLHRIEDPAPWPGYPWTQAPEEIAS